MALQKIAGNQNENSVVLLEKTTEFLVKLNNLLIRLRSHPQVWFNDFKAFGKFLCCFFVGN